MVLLNKMPFNWIHLKLYMRDIVTLQLIPTVSMQTKVANFNGGQGRMRTDVFFLSVEIASID